MDADGLVDRWRMTFLGNLGAEGRMVCGSDATALWNHES